MTSGRRNLTKADKERGQKLHDLGCIICLKIHGVYTYPAIHHIDGKVYKGCHQLTLPLCPKHHQEKCNESIDGMKMWVSRHGDGRAAFEAHYGTEQELLEEVNELINA